MGHAGQRVTWAEPEARRSTTTVQDACQHGSLAAAPLSTWAGPDSPGLWPHGVSDSQQPVNSLSTTATELNKLQSVVIRFRVYIQQSIESTAYNQTSFK